MGDVLSWAAPDAVVPLGHENWEQATRTLMDAFSDYPVLRYVLGDDADRDLRLNALVGFFVMARLLRGEPVLGVYDHSALNGVALVSYPDRPSPPELDSFRESVWHGLGHAARERYEAFGRACEPFTPGVPHIHLNMIGVRPTARGTGVARRLLEHVHGISRDDPQSKGVTLTTESAPNVGLYEHFGYAVLGHARVAAELETWGMFRPDP
ncbi:MAG: GNAT family N-acetyltransferase [Gemmatimonadota bacterium]|jgi:GNAT superfamily N-acetyltransferase